MARPVLYGVLYGTISPERWQEDRLAIRPAVLHEYRRQRVRFCEFPAIVPKASATVKGAFITGLTTRDVVLLDLFEGSMYERRKVKVRLLKDTRVEDNVPDSRLESLEGEEVEAETYVWADSVGDLEDKEWDFEQFKSGKMKSWMADPRSAWESDDEGFAAANSLRSTQPRVAPTGGRGTGRPNRRSPSRGDRSTGSPARGDRGMGSPPRAERGVGSPPKGDRGSNDRGTGNRGSGGGRRGGGRGGSGRGDGGRGGGDRGRGDRGAGGRAVADKGTGIRGASNQGTSGQGAAGAGAAGVISNQLKDIRAEMNKIQGRDQPRGSQTMGSIRSSDMD